MLFLSTCSKIRLQLAVSTVPQMSSLWEQEIFLVHSIILLLSYVAPLAVSQHNERVVEVQLESEGKAQGKLLAAEATAAPV